MSPYLTKAIHQRAYADAYRRWAEANRLGLQRHRLEYAWPSTSKDPADRQHVSPLGGTALEKEQR
jgi:hypothetical protein